MGKQLTSGQIESLCGYGRYEEEEKPMTLPQYIKRKVKILHDFGYTKITKEFFNGCRSETHVDNRARSVIFQRY